MKGFGVGGSRWDVHSRWSLHAAREIDLSPLRVEGFVGDALTEALDMAVAYEEPRRWRATLRRPLSLFDLCEVTVTVVGSAEDSMSRVEIEVAFDTSSSRLGLSMNVGISVVGLPIVFGWRYQSVRSAKAQAKEIIAAVWSGLDARMSATAYR